jgi:multisubunit Na+/H+ antiporter MnhB subunit
MEFWDYRTLPSLTKWCIFILSVFTIILANAGAITLSATTTAHRDPDGIIAATLIASSSVIAHTLQVISTPPRSREFPHVRKVLAALLVVAFIAHAVSIVYLRSTHDEFFDKLSKLVCFFHGVLAENITKIWSYLHQGWSRPWCFENVVVYLLLAI